MICIMIKWYMYTTSAQLQSQHVSKQDNEEYIKGKVIWEWRKVLSEAINNSRTVIVAQRGDTKMEENFY
jgi:hypothetical protein